MGTNYEIKEKICVRDLLRHPNKYVNHFSFIRKFGSNIWNMYLLWTLLLITGFIQALPLRFCRNYSLGKRVAPVPSSKGTLYQAFKPPWQWKGQRIIWNLWAYIFNIPLVYIDMFSNYSIYKSTVPMRNNIILSPIFFFILSIDFALGVRGRVHWITFKWWSKIGAC